MLFQYHNGPQGKMVKGSLLYYIGKFMLELLVLLNHFLSVNSSFC